MDKPIDGDSLHALDGRAGRTESEKKRTWWEVEYELTDRKQWGRVWKTHDKNAALGVSDALTKKGHKVRVWRVESVERTETVRELATGSPID
jgi:hypothetical protein